MENEDDFELEQLPLSAEIVQVTVQLSEEQGQELKDLIREIYPHAFPNFCRKVGIKTPNFYNVLNGNKPCTLEFLNKVLSGINYQATISNPEIVIQEMEIGQIVPDVDSIIHEIELQSKEAEEPEEPDSFL